MEMYILHTNKDGSGNWYYSLPFMPCGLTIEDIAERCCPENYTWSLISKDDLIAKKQNDNINFGYKKLNEDM